jgi:molybdopterin molybdotransferase
MKLLTVDTIDTARKKLLDCAKKMDIPRVQNVHVYHAAGRVCAGVSSPCNVPAFKRSVVDGYAVFSRDTSGATETIPAFLTVVDSVKMGHAASVPIKSGECAYVPTGGMIPEGADAVVMIEYVEPFGDGKIAVYESVATGAHIALAGEDVQKGNVLVPRGTVIRPEEVGALAGAGVIEVPVFEAIRLTIISTGDELVPPEHEPAPGEIRDINSYAIRAMAASTGFNAAGFHVLADDEERLEQTIRGAMEICNIIVVSGGSSQGDKDITAEVISRIAKPGLLTHGVAIKPGKPAILGWDEESKTILAGLPGHPVSAIVVFQILFSWLVKTLTGQKEPFLIPARMSCNIAGSPGKACVQPVSLTRKGMEYTAEPVLGKSGMMTTLTKGDGYVLIDMNTEGLKKGEQVLVQLY